MVASIVLAGLVVLPAPSAEAARATGGSARFPNVEWISWGTHQQKLTPDGSGKISTTEEFTRGGDDYVVTCSISNLARTRGSGNDALLIAYRPGFWQGDGFDNLYNIGGTDGANQLVVGLRNWLDANTITFDFDCAATVERNGVETPFPLAGLVMANAESSISAGSPTFREHVAATISDTGTWRIIDRLRGAQCTQSVYASQTTPSAGQRQLVLNGANNTDCEGDTANRRPNPMAIAYMEGVSSAKKVTLAGRGFEAIALGVVVVNDFGDAPSSYGAAGAIVQPRFSGGTVSNSGNPGQDLFAGAFTLADQTAPTPRLGATVDFEGAPAYSANATADDTAGADDEDAVVIPSAGYHVRSGETMTVSDVACTASSEDPGSVAGWIDFDGDESFGAHERSDVVACPTGGGLVNLSFAVPDELPESARGSLASFLRVRIAPRAADLTPTGTTIGGEVEDHAVPLTWDVPELTLSKTSSSTPTKAGDPVSYSFMITNSGNVTLRNLDFSDSMLGLEAIPAGATWSAGNATTGLPAGATITFSRSSAASQAEVDAGEIENVATVSGTSVAGDEASASDDVTITIAPAPQIEIEKTSTSTVAKADDPVSYSFTITNRGNVTLGEIEFSDSLLGVSQVPEGSTWSTGSSAVDGLAPGGTITFSLPHTATQTQVDAGLVKNAAEVTATTPAGGSVDDDDEVSITVPRSAGIQIVKTGELDGTGVVGDPVDYAFAITNLGNVTLSELEFTDALLDVDEIPADAQWSADSFATTGLLPGGTITFSLPHEVTQADVDAGAVVNTATIEGTTPMGGTVTDDDGETLTIATRAAGLTLEKSTDSTPAVAGDSVVYDFVLTNTGNVTLTEVTFSDPLLGAVAIPGSAVWVGGSAGTGLAPGGTVSFSLDHVVSLGEADAGKVDNTATATAKTPTGGTVDAEGSETVLVKLAPRITIEKGAVFPADAGVGDEVTYTFRIRNAGNVTLDHVAFADELLGADEIPAGATWVDGSAVTGLEPGGTVTFELTRDLTQSDVDAGSVVNTASVEATAPDSTVVTDDDAATVTTQVAEPRIEVSKSSSSTPTKAGDTITYELSIRNAGNVTLKDVTFEDEPLGISSLPPTGVTWSTGSTAATGLAPGGTVTFSLSHVVTQAEADAGQVENSAAAGGTPPSGTPVTDGDTETVTITPAPAIELRKSSTSAPVRAEDTITYDFVIENTGNVTLTGIVFSDALLGVAAIPSTGATWSSGSSSATGLAPGGTVSFSLDHTVTQDEIDAGEVENSASAGGTPPTGGPVTDGDTETVTITPTPRIEVRKTGSLEAEADGAVGDEITFSFVVENTGNVMLTDIAFSDALLGLSALPTGADVEWSAGSSADGGLVPGGTITFSRTYEITQDDVDAGSVINLATTAGTPPTGADVTDDDGATVPTEAAGPAIELRKTSSSTPEAADDAVTYDFVIENTGNVTLRTITFSDPLLGVSALPSTGVTWSSGSSAATGLAPGGTASFSLDHTVTQAQVDAGEVENSATAGGTPPTGAPVTDGDTETVTITPDPSIEVRKSGAVDGDGAVGDELSWSFGIENTGNVTLTAIGFTDDLLGITSLPTTADVVWSTGSSADDGLAPGGTITFSRASAVTQGQVDAGEAVNTAAVSGTPPTGPAVTDEDSATVPTEAADPGVSLSKTSSSEPERAGETITYEFVITNTGNVTLTSLEFSDDLLDVAAIPADADWPTGSSLASGLAPGGTVTFSLGHVVTQGEVDAGSVVNSADVTADSPDGTGVDDEDAVTVTITPDPSIEVRKSSSSTPERAGQTISYDFVIENTGNVTLTDISFEDELLDLSALPSLGVTWSTGSSAAYGLAPGGTVSFSLGHTATQVEVDAGEVVNTASVEGTPPSGPAVGDDDSETVTIPADPSIEVRKSSSSTPEREGDVITYAFVIENQGNVTLTDVAFTDSLLGVAAVPGTATWSTGSSVADGLAPGGTVSFSLAHTVTQLEVDAGEVVNTASTAGTPPSGAPVDDDDSVTVAIIPDPSITVAKTGTLAGHGAVGDEITYSFVITNTGNVTLTGLAFDDTMLGVATIPPGATWVDGDAVDGLAPNGTVTFSLTYVIDQADVDAGSVVNTVAVAGTPPTGAPVDADDAETVPTEPAAPAITLSKSSSSAPTAAGETVSYAFVITNMGNVTLTDIAFSDALLDVATVPVDAVWTLGSPTTGLAPGGTVSFGLDHVVSQAEVDAGAVSNSASASGQPPTGARVDADDAVTIPVPASPAVELVKTGSVEGEGKVGDRVTFSFLVTNTGNVTLSKVTVEDPMPGLSAIRFGEWPGRTGALAPGESVTATARYTLTQADVEADRVENSATVTGAPPGTDAPVTDDDTVTVVPGGASPEISLEKTAHVVGGGTMGDVIEYSFVATNTGNVRLTEVEIIDLKDGLYDFTYGEWPRAAGVLDPGESVTATARYRITAGDVEAGVVHNSARATGSALDGVVAEDSDAVAATVGTMAETGSQLLIPGGLSLVLVALGIILVAVRRRDREAQGS